MNTRSYDTLTEALTDLKARGYTNDFNIADDCLECQILNAQFTHDMFDVDETYRFEGDSNPSDSSILFAITSSSGVKGVLVNAFGMYSEPVPEMLRDKLRFHSQQ
jgi:hypothetical protein